MLVVKSSSEHTDHMRARVPTATTHPMSLRSEYRRDVGEEEEEEGEKESVQFPRTVAAGTSACGIGGECGTPPRASLVAHARAASRAGRLACRAAAAAVAASSMAVFDWSSPSFLGGVCVVVLVQAARSLGNAWVASPHTPATVVQ